MGLDKPKNEELFESVAAENGVAVVVVDENGREISAANNNSICRVLYPSTEFGPRCAEYCGKVFERTENAGGTAEYECHAGLTCKAVPITRSGERRVAIVGRTFLKAENYRAATEKAIGGEWSKFRPTEFFENILMTGSMVNLEKAVENIEAAEPRVTEDILDLDAPPMPAILKVQESEKPITALLPSDEISRLVEKFNQNIPSGPAEPKSSPEQGELPKSEDTTAWRSLFGSLMKLEYSQACRSVLDFLANRYGSGLWLWLERRNDHLEPSVVHGEPNEKPFEIAIAADSPLLLDAARRDNSVALRERKSPGSIDLPRTLNLFPVSVGGEIRGAIAVEGKLDGEIKKRISRFARNTAPQLEILRLRDEVSQRDWLSRAVRRFNENLKKIDADDFWQHVTQISAELLQAERASLLIRNEKSDSFHAKATVGARINLFTEENMGNRVARQVLERGNPVVVSDILSVGLQHAPREWKYKSSSFISYPIMIGNRRIGVLNFTDKAGGDNFTERDLELLHAIAPQIAVAIDRTAMKDKAGEYEQLSVTDPLTGLLNRRYIEERLTEEIKRSKRTRNPMSFMMLDVDSFKAYNDSFGHPAGDHALKVVAGVLKETLRGADVAARYGGEEFAILLPQTTCEEAAAIAERIRHQVERTEFTHRRVTVSIGIAGCSADIASVKEIISAADVALYQAKNQGRNRVKIFENSDRSFSEKIH